MLVEGSARFTRAAWQADAFNRAGEICTVIRYGTTFDRERIALIFLVYSSFEKNLYHLSLPEFI